MCLLILSIIYILTYSYVDFLIKASQKSILKNDKQKLN